MDDVVSGDIRADEYWAQKGDVKLFMFRKRLAGDGGARPVVFLVHGSSFAARTTYDLEIPEHGEYSLMNALARRGFEVWTMDHEGYGRSTRTAGWSDIADGVEDLRAAVELVERETGHRTCAFFGSSSGALRAGAFANACPERVERLAMAAFVWTGENSPTLARRAERIDEWRATNRRVVDEETYRGIFSRDVEGLTVPELPKAAAAAEMANGGGSVPNGTYIDMCVNLPSVDPTNITCPVLIFRGDHDGIATEEDVTAFFTALPTREKQIVMVAGQAHNTTLGINRHRFWHVLHGFMGSPSRLD